MIAFLLIVRALVIVLGAPFMLVGIPLVALWDELNDAIARRRRMRREEEARRHALDVFCALIASRPEIQREVRRRYETTRWS